MRKYTKSVLSVLLLVQYALLGNTQVVPQKWSAKFTPGELEVDMDTNTQVLLELFDVNVKQTSRIQVQSENLNLAQTETLIKINEINPTTGYWTGNITVKALFLGQTRLFVELTTTDNEIQTSSPELTVTIVRALRPIDIAFTVSVALLVSLLYINFGAALDLSVLSGLLRRPVGPTIGFFTQFIIMPLLSFGLGCLLFPDSVEMQLGLFFTGVSPSGGASNIWTVLLGGNINLSVLMTTISNIAAFGMMPLWIFTLGHVIFNRGKLGVPYGKIATFAVSLIVPLAIGVTIQKCSPRITRVLVRLLKPISTMLILFIIVFAIVTNLYLFKLFSWKIIIAGLGLPWLGYGLSWIVAKLMKQTQPDALTIAIETGIQNTGIAIFLLRFSLPQPQADLTTVIPVSVAIMTPFPLLALYLCKKFNDRRSTATTGESQSII
ncbi:P3 protein [Episyrphus balteatus]|uniref:P3 protein n=1 Tax=Episyrphus balteatus TaxID=286459 RepID=UPI0024866D8D|nr:P3 protein [Episyrphus balteatus]